MRDVDIDTDLLVHGQTASINRPLRPHSHAENSNQSYLTFSHRTAVRSESEPHTATPLLTCELVFVGRALEETCRAGEFLVRVAYNSMRCTTQTAAPMQVAVQVIILYAERERKGERDGGGGREVAREIAVQANSMGDNRGAPLEQRQLITQKCGDKSIRVRIQYSSPASCRSSPLVLQSQH